MVCMYVCLCAHDTVTSVTTIEIRIYIKIYQFVVVVDVCGGPALLRVAGMPDMMGMATQP